MLINLARFFGHRFFARGDIRLAMTILVKDEQDIIEDNIRVHAALGVDAFAVMDNGSTDGTREKLEVLKSEYDLHVIDQPEQSYRQRQWMTQLAFYARKHFGADWIISNDADEFWLPARSNQEPNGRDQGDLKQGLTRRDALITCRRYNMLLTGESSGSGRQYHHSTLRTRHPVFYDRRAQLEDDEVSLPLVKISPKVMINPYGLSRIKGGNHRANHAAGFFAHRQAVNLAVYHYPIRTYEKFRNNILNRQRLLRAHPDARMGDHYRRWVRLLEEDRLEEEYRRFVYDDRDIAVLERFGIVQRDTMPAEVIGRYAGP